MLEVNALCYEIPNRKLLDDIHFHLSPGQVLGVIGRNGAGKSTLVKSCCGELRPTAGQVLWQKKSLYSYPEKELARQKAVLSQKINPEGDLLVYEALLMGRYPYRPLGTDDYLYIDQMIAHFQLEHLLTQKLSTLSGGELQRVRFAMVYSQLLPLSAHEAKILFLDEPTNSLDLEHQQTFFKYLRTIVSETKLCAMVVIHDLNLAASYCDQLILLDQGKKIVSGRVQEVLTKETIKKYFKVDIEIISHPTQQQIPYIQFI